MRKKIVFISILLFIISFLIILALGRKTTLEYDINNMENISVIYDKNIIKCKEYQEKEKIKLIITPVNKGKTEIIISGIIQHDDSNDENKQYKKKIYVHNMGVITKNNYFGNCNGDISIIISIFITLLMWLFYAIIQFRNGIKKNIYEYRNIRLLGLIIFISVVFILNLYVFIIDLLNNYHSSFYNTILNIRESSTIFSIFMLPIAIITSILVTISNILLIKNEGKTWKNMLGIIFGGFLCIGTILFVLLGSSSTNINNTSTIIINIICYISSIGIAYLECILFGTIILGYVSAIHIPKFDKDYIIILGCKIKSDGTLTPLLKARVDRAIEFARLQKENTDKDIIYIPSGGKGKDEVISEAQAMKNYLIDQGVKEKYILLEDKSRNTFENIKFSYKIIQKKMKNPNIAFSTTNYHVFRAGTIASKQNIKIEGIGAKTRTYYWINAFIREFVATIVFEKDKHIKTIIILMISFLIVTIIYYISLFYI